MAVRYKRGQQHPSNAQLFFFRYAHGKEVWVTIERLNHANELKRAVNARQRSKPEHKERMKLYFRKYNKRESQKQYHSDYWKRPEVRQRLRDKWNASPEIIARREAQLKQKQERAAYRASDEFKTVLKERSKRQWLKRKESGKSREYDRNKWHTNTQHRLGQNMRRLIHSVMVRRVGHKKAHRTFELIGCSIEALKVHLESLFTYEMSWENYGTYWEVDHKFPLARFDLTDPLQQKQAFHFENLQPLEKIANRKKSDKAEGVQNIIPFKAA